MTILTTYELSAKAQVSRRTLQRWAKEGYITPVSKNQPGNCWDWEPVRDWLAETGRWDEVVESPIRLLTTPMDYCKRDHEMSYCNTYMGTDGRRRCRACRRLRHRQYYARKKAA